MAEEEREVGAGRPWLRAWLVVGLAAWAQVGVLLVGWAQRKGLVADISFSPYHLVGYAALLTLAGYVGWAIFRGLRHGDWRHAFPPMYGGLGLACLLLLAWVVLDIAWRSTLGINPGIEEGLSPPRLLIPIALALLAAGPLREAIAARSRPGVEGGELRIRWAGVIGAGLIGGAFLLLPFNPLAGQLNDYAVNPGVDSSEIWTMTADGSDQSRLLVAYGDGVDYSLPAWSPDGSRIAYTVWTNDDGAVQNVRVEDQRSEIWTMNADGSDRRLVFDNGLVSTTQNLQAWIPAWSPDGAWIAFTVSPLGSAPGAAAQPQANPAPGQMSAPASAAGSSLWIVHPDGTGSQQISREAIDAFSLVWAPGVTGLAVDPGPNVAFLVDTGGGTSDIHVASLAPAFQGSVLTDERAIAADVANDWAPTWSPDGARIAFASDRAGNDDIWIATLDGAAPTQLTADDAGDWVPAFSPDGARIAFVSERTGEPEIWSMAADGSDLRNLTNHPRAFDGQWSVAWSPDGARLAYATAPFPDASSSGWVRDDLAAAQAILFGIGLAIVALLIVALGAPLGSFTLALVIIAALGVFPAEAWRFLPGAAIAGLLVDALVRSVRLRHRARLAAAALPALANLAFGLTIGAGGTLVWSITLLLGVTLASAVLGWALAAASERLFPRPVASSEAAAA